MVATTIHCYSDCIFEFHAPKNPTMRTFISVCNQPPRSTQPGHPFMGRHNEYQPKGDALRLRIKQVWFMWGWQVKLCDPLVTHGPYQSRVMRCLYMKRYINSSVYFTLLYYRLNTILAVFCENLVAMATLFSSLKI